MKRKRVVAKENHDRWLVSYADFVTLLFAFFVVLFASSQADKTRARQISEAVRKALSGGSTAPRVATVLGGTVDDLGRGNALLRGPAMRKPEKPQEPAPKLLDLESSSKLLRAKLSGEIARGSVDVQVEERGVIISLNSNVFFPSGGDVIAERAYPTLGKVAEVLNQLPNALRLEGHTDAVPIQNTRFRSNWELSAARSIAMLRVLNENYQVDRRRMAIVGYAETFSIGSNDTAEGRQRNRRVDIVIVSSAGLKNEPGNTPPASKQPPA